MPKPDDKPSALKKALTTWGLVTKVITGTAATVVVIFATVNWFQPRAVADSQHEGIAQVIAQSAVDATRDGLEAELERVETKLKLYAAIKSSRELTADEELEFGYLLTRHEEITKRLYAKEG